MKFPRLKLIAVGAADIHGRDSLLVNDDLQPLKLADRTWSTLTYLSFWFSASATVSQWYVSSPGQALGLSMWESLGCYVGGQVLIAFVITLNGRPGAIYHVGFPIINRAAFGVYGAWWPTFNRAVMAIVWNGVNIVQGGQCIYVMLHAIFPSIKNLPSHMGSGSALDTGGMIGLVLFWLVSWVFLIIPVPQMRSLVYAKMVIFFISAIAMLAWIVTKAGGLGPIVSQGSTVHGVEKSWLIARFFMLGAANCATFASNAADFQRYAKKSSAVIPGNLVGFPLASLVIGLIGNLLCAASQPLFGEIIWNPVTLLDLIQSREYTAANRAGCFFISLAFTYCAICSCVFENFIPAGNDIAALAPRYFTVKRGFYICAIISIAINPWYLLGSASIFVSFLASYQIFLSSITGVLLVNYYMIGKGCLQIPDCFTSSRGGVYYYFHGWNLRAYAAYALGIIPNFWGFLNNMGVKAPTGVTRFYYFAYIVGVFISGGSYWILCKIWPPEFSAPVWQEPKDYIRPDEESQTSIMEGIEAENTTSNEISERIVKSE